MSDADLNAALEKAGVPPETAAVIVDHNAASRINGLRASLGVLALIALIGVIFTRRLPVRQGGPGRGGKGGGEGGPSEDDSIDPGTDREDLPSLRSDGG